MQKGFNSTLLLVSICLIAVIILLIYKAGGVKNNPTNTPILFDTGGLNVPQNPNTK